LDREKTLTPKNEEEETFSNAAINDRGDLLYALSYGVEEDGEKIGTLNCWRIEDGLIIQEVPELTCYYRMVSNTAHTIDKRKLTKNRNLQITSTTTSQYLITLLKAVSSRLLMGSSFLPKAKNHLQTAAKMLSESITLKSTIMWLRAFSITIYT
jgi:hypothetical protein